MDIYEYSKLDSDGIRKLIEKVLNGETTESIVKYNDMDIAIIPGNEYRAMKETFYLLSSKKNRNRLLASIDEIENGRFTVRELLSW